MKLQDLLTKEEYQELCKKLPVVIRVHGDHHQELLALNEEFKTCLELSDDKLKDSLRKIKTITNMFKVPDDACITYKRVYELLNNAYQKIEY